MFNIKKIVIAIVIFFFIPVVSVQASNLGGGYCGDEVKWVLDGEGNLIISGKGDITSAPWDEYAENIKSVDIKEGITGICSSAFYTDKYSVKAPYAKLATVSIGNTVTTIGRQAFCGCAKLESVKLPKKLSGFGAGAFMQCTALKSIAIPDKVKKIGDDEYGRVFGGCTSLADVSLGKVKEIGYAAFSGCTALKSITIPDTVSDIDKDAFSECSSLSDIKFKEGESALNIKCDAFAHCESLESIILPDRICEIYGSGFLGDGGAFRACTALKKMVIGSEVQSIGMNVFYGCESLKEIYFCGNAPEFGDPYSDIVFASVTATAYYPKGNSTWDASSLANHGGTIVWKPWEVPISHSVQKGISLKAIKGGIAVSWDKNSNVSGYYIYRKVNNGGWKKYKEIPSYQRKYSDVKLKNGVKYSYKVYPFKGSEIGQTYEIETMYYVKRPTITSVKKTSYGYVVKWNRNAKANSYTIMYSASSSFPSYNIKSVRLDKKQNTYRIYTYDHKKMYVKIRARVYGVNENLINGDSVWSKVKKLS